jgi:exodeoxyribonuclease VII small subunit
VNGERTGTRERDRATAAAAGDNAAAGAGALPGVDAPGFAAAMAELEAILSRIEAEEIDVDALAAELRRAAQLLEVCRAKIRRAEAEVTQIVQQLAEGEGG